MSEELEPLIEKTKEFFELRAKKADIAKKTKELNSQFAEVQGSILKMLQASDLQKFHVPAFGVVYMEEHASYTTPKTWEDKKAFLDWVKENKGEDVMQSYISVASKGLNEFCTTEMKLAEESAIKEGTKLTFKIPGIAEPKPYYKVGGRKS